MTAVVEQVEQPAAKEQVAQAVPAVAEPAVAEQPAVVRPAVAVRQPVVVPAVVVESVADMLLGTAVAAALSLPQYLQEVARLLQKAANSVARWHQA